MDNQTQPQAQPEKKGIQIKAKDEILKKAIKNFSGMRILRQNPFQCYISFLK